MMMTSWAAPSTKIWDQYYKTVFTVRNTTALKLRQYFDALFEVLSFQVNLFVLPASRSISDANSLCVSNHASKSRQLCYCKIRFIVLFPGWSGPCRVQDLLGKGPMQSRRHIQVWYFPQSLKFELSSIARQRSWISRLWIFLGPNCFC